MLVCLLMTILQMVTLTSCSDDNDEIEQPEPVTKPAFVTDSVRYEKEKAWAYNIQYPSTDPYGKPVMLSGTITIGDEVSADKHARGMLLYNHYTVYRANQCPSKGNLTVEKIVCGSGLITVSADYYGFGVTESQPQAYCISSVNAQASVDALLAARQLLKARGYTWDDTLFNLGYSQGGQTTIAVVRLVTEKYPDVRLTYSFAGAGSYDLPETYRQFIKSGSTAMPSTVISVMLAYNEFFQLGIPRTDLFVQPTLGHIDDWILSKRYTREEIDSKIGTQEIAGFVTPAMLDLNSDISRKMLEALDKDNLCKGWTPRKDERIYLFHNTLDRTVPVANTENLSAFFKQQGCVNVSTIYGEYETLSGKIPPHEVGALFFALDVAQIVCDTLNIELWFEITPDLLRGEG